MILLNEHDGSFFDHYCDANGGALTGKEIGTWEKATAEWVEFVDSRYLVKLRFQAIAESEMYRGQEVVPGGLSWVGISYVIACPVPTLTTT